MPQEVRDAINSCNNWRELASVIEAKSSIMDAENISNVMVLVRQTQNEMLEVFSGLGQGCGGGRELLLVFVCLGLVGSVCLLSLSQQ
eukprot:1158109-Pelagomonas_calceolata.AAC.15